MLCDATENKTSSKIFDTLPEIYFLNLFFAASSMVHVAILKITF